MKLRKLIAFCCLFAFVLTPSSWAQVEDLKIMIQDLQKQMSAMQKLINQQNMKIQDLERRQPSAQIAAPSAEPTPPMSDYEFNERLGGALGGANKWLKDLKFSGDTRLRYEAFHHGSGHPSETDDRNRFRYRLRFGFEKPFGEQFLGGFSLASGEVGTSGNSLGFNVDPTSTNTTFDNNFNFKPIFIEKAYGSYKPSWAKVGPVSKVEITAGKFTNPFERGSSDIIWDRDVKPEGAYQKIDLKLLETSDLKVNAYAVAGQYILDEDAAATNASDAEMYGYQIGINPVVYAPFLERPVDILSAVSYYDFADYDRSSNFMINGATSLARGNSVCGTNLCTSFKIWDFYNEIAIYPYGIPVRPFYDFAHNEDEGGTLFDSSAWAMGLKLGSLVKKGDWETSAAYKWLGRDAVTGFNDSDFTGSTTTHTGTRGIVFKAGYLFTDRLSLNGAAAFLENLNPGASVAGSIIRDEQQRRFQLDLGWKF